MKVGEVARTKRPEATGRHGRQPARSGSAPCASKASANRPKAGIRWLGRATRPSC